MINKIKNLLFLIIESLIRNISGYIGINLRKFYYKKRFARCGKNLKICEGVIIEGIKDIYLGNNICIDKYCILMAGKLPIPENQIKHKKNINYKFNDGELHIGSNTHIAPQCIIQAHGGVNIDKNFTSSAGTKIYSLSNDVVKCNFGTNIGKNIHYILSQINIEENVWVGLNSIILGGNIGKDSFIAPNSVVINQIEENSFTSGTPAKKMKNRFK